MYAYGRLTLKNHRLLAKEMSFAVHFSLVFGMHKLKARIKILAVVTVVDDVRAYIELSPALAVIDKYAREGSTYRVPVNSKTETHFFEGGL